MRRERARRFWPSGGAGSGAPLLTLTAITPDIGFRLLTGSTAPYLRTITGTGFTPGTTVTVGGVAATNVTIVSPTTITCNVGTLGSAGDKDVTVTQGLTGISRTLVGAYTVEIAELWYRGDVGNGASWTDLGDNGQHAVQGTGAAQPAVTPAAINGHTGLTGDAVDDFMLAPCVMNTAQHVTYLAMKSNANTVGNEGVRGLIGVGATGDNNSSNSGVMFRNTVNFSEFSSPNVLSSAVGPANGATALIESRYSGTQHIMRCNASTGAPIAQSATMNIDRLYLFCRFISNAPAIFGPYTLGEVLVFATDPAAGVRTKVRTYLANRYGQANFI